MVGPFSGLDDRCVKCLNACKMDLVTHDFLLFGPTFIMQRLMCAKCFYFFAIASAVTRLKNS
jgi:hypothetical protein